MIPTTIRSRTTLNSPTRNLFDKSIRDIEKHHYELARLTLQTLLNTYPDSEYTLLRPSWLSPTVGIAKEPATRLAQAEAEYKDFITFFPTMQEASESQMKVCQIHYEQMQKADRDNTHALRADSECRQMLMQFPNSVFVEDTDQLLRDIQEVVAEAEYRVGAFYCPEG